MYSVLYFKRNKYDNGPAWKQASNGRYYLHQFKENEPDLNLRNPKVLNEVFVSNQLGIESLRYFDNVINIEGCTKLLVRFRR